MKQIRPLIGLTPNYDNDKSLSNVKNGYYEGILETGGLPVIIPLTVDKSILDDFFSRVDGLLLTGGADIDARFYGENNMQYNGDISPLRDEMELYLAKRALESDKPVFGICRGIQILNVTAGGTLYQDISSQLKDKDVLKHFQSAPVWYGTQDIRIEKGFKVWESFRRECVSVNSFHHQAVKDTGEGFAVTSRAGDGIIESIEHPGYRFAVGVQWHPETMWGKDPVHLGIFKMFVDSCRG